MNQLSEMEGKMNQDGRKTRMEEIKRSGDTFQLKSDMSGIGYCNYKLKLLSKPYHFFMMQLIVVFFFWFCFLKATNPWALLPQFVLRQRESINKVKIPLFTDMFESF